MIKILSILPLLLAIEISFASEQPCSGFGLAQAHSPMSVQGVTVCFFYKEEKISGEESLSVDPLGIFVSSINKDGSLSYIYDLPYAGTEGVINDAFLLSIDDSNEKRLFVVHSVKAPSSWDVVSDIYDVSAIKSEAGFLARDDRISRFFDMGGDFVDVKGEITYRYPYKGKKSVEEAVKSPIFQAIRSFAPVEGKIKKKTFLYGGDEEANMREPSKMYLIKGDRVKVEDSIAGWCKILYVAKIKLIKMWVNCEAISFS